MRIIKAEYLSPITTANDQYIRVVQSYLTELSKVNEKIKPLIIDGTLGEETKEAVSEFQSLAGMEATGIPDSKTFDRLKAEYFKQIKLLEPPTAFNAFPNKDAIFREGDFHPCIFSVQFAFFTLSKLYSNFSEPEFSGIIDKKTQKNIEELRKLSELNEGSFLDKALWNLLAQLHNSLSKTIFSQKNHNLT